MTRKSRRTSTDPFDWDGPAPAETPDDADGDERPSRSARKRASEELQKTGEALLSLRAQSLERLDLPERLLDALAEAKRLTSFGAKRRQMQFIGKLMRKLEPEALEAIEAALAAQPGGRSSRR